MLNKKKNSNGNNKEHTLKDASSKLDISETTVKKYLKDFDLEIIKSGNKPAVSEETFRALSEIVKLRANGLSMQEIKELKSQEPSKSALDELEEEESKSIPVLPDTESKKSEMPIEIELSDVIKEEADIEYAELKEESKEEEKEAVKEGESSIKDREDEEDEDGEQSESEGEQRRRRLFNYRYVERQISNDTKKIDWLRQRLKSPNVSSQDKLLFEESLERRIMFLDGWRHILRWVSSK